MLYNASDIFIMPNMTVPGDMEGFGIVALEAGSCGLPVIASNIEGIQDAVIDGKTGYLVREGDVEGFLRGIRDMNLKKADVRREVASRYNWKTISGEYFRVLFS
jgi:glycosyltransferase involved in cell wall biosynthesis